MKNEELNQLIDELKAAGAQDKEAEELSVLSQKLSEVSKLERSFAFKKKFLERDIIDNSSYRSFWSKWTVIPAVAFCLIFFVGFATVVSAEKSFRGKPLYPIKRLSEGIISFINPSFKNEVLRRRSEEIKELSDKKDGADFQKTVEDYEKELSENKRIAPEKFEESRKNLEEAKKKSLDENREDIERLIIQTEDKQKLLDLSPSSSQADKESEEDQNSDQELKRLTNPQGR